MTKFNGNHIEASGLPVERASGDPRGGLLAARREERSALAEILHDGLAQTLTAASAHLDAYRIARERHDEERAARLLARGLESLEVSIQEIRRVMRELREGEQDTAGSASALHSRALGSEGEEGP